MGKIFIYTLLFALCAVFFKNLVDIIVTIKGSPESLEDAEIVEVEEVHDDEF